MKIRIIEEFPENDFLEYGGMNVEIGNSSVIIKIARPDLKEFRSGFTPKTFDILCRVLPIREDQTIYIGEAADENKYYVNKIVPVLLGDYDCIIYIFNYTLNDKVNAYINNHFEKRKNAIMILKDELVYSPNSHCISFPANIAGILSDFAQDPNFDFQKERGRLQRAKAVARAKKLSYTPATQTPTAPERPFDISNYVTTQTGATYFVNGEERYLEPSKPESKPLPFWRRFLNLYK